jgi:serine/threonine protein kinase
VPTKIGPYRILDVLYSGSGRALYKVTTEDGRVLALKAIPVEGLAPEMRERFLREAEICRTLDHVNLVHVYDAGEADGHLYQVMDLLVGSDFGTVFASGRSFTWQEKLALMEQVCAGLEYAHARKLVHRDIKPANLFLEDSGRVRLLDFGMARVESSQLTMVGSTVGTLNYMSPEQIRGQRCTPASDVFSTGIVFYQLASGRHPFSSRDRSLPQVVSAIAFEEQPKLSELCPDAPEGLEFLLSKALSKDPVHRPQSGGSMKHAVRLCLLALDTPASPAPPAAAPQPAPPPFAAPPEARKPTSKPDEVKTMVARRVESLVPVKPPPAPTASTAAPVFVPPVRAASIQLRPRYCPSCTFANPATATVCSRCSYPLVNTPAAAPPEKSRPWNLYLAIAIAALLAIALVVVWIVKS